jgi:hypothetical protein
MGHNPGMSIRGEPRRVTKYYGLRSLLAVISLPLAYISASRGGTGWQERSEREAEQDAEKMMKRGYRVVSAEERSWPVFGIYFQRVVYELADRPRAG